MRSEWKNAHAAGFECLAAWSDLLDRINVFPVADGDTGRNLVISLAPLRSLDGDRDKTAHRLMLQARGNSGNIAARFFVGFLESDSGKTILEAVRAGRDMARQAVSHPLPGTMLTVFDALAAHLETTEFKPDPRYAAGLMRALEKTVRGTVELLPRLKAAGVVDAGALGMYIFLGGFFNRLSGDIAAFPSVEVTFEGQLRVLPSFREDKLEGHCVDTVIRLNGGAGQDITRFSECGESAVIIPHRDCVKVHFHTADARAAAARIGSFGRILQWSDDDLAVQATDFMQQPLRGPVHIMTDAAGSLTREDARNLGITLLDSYISAGDECVPETLFSAARLYQGMRRGMKASTSQASVFERHRHYQRAVERYRHVLYLCVGSVYTGNYSCAIDWKRQNDPENRLTVIDTGAASGRLATIVIATARAAAGRNDFGALVEYAEKAVDRCEEFVFLDKLKYLAAGGRLSKPGAFLGDMFHAKPIITPAAAGAKKVGLVKSRSGQLAFALKKLSERFGRDAAPFIMLEYSDNKDWVAGAVRNRIAADYPRAEISVQPLSLTSGVHMGPGTWGMAYLP